jgi:hypothetical protein
MKRDIIVWWKLWFVVALLIGLASCAFGQWDQVTVISPDSFYNPWPQFVVDDSFHLHVFCARGMNHISMQPSSLVYLKFDNWGNLLSGPTNLWPDSQYTDFSPGVLLDRSGTIHLVWSREWDSPWRPRVMYARMNTDGQFLTAPTVIDSTTTVQQGMNLVQALSGDVWGVGGGYMCAFHESGEIFVPFQRIFPEESGADCMYPIAAPGPDGHVYASVRYFSPGDTQCVAVTRLDTVDREVTVISPGTSPSDPVQMGAGDFFVDSTGVWHSTIGRDDSPWWYYQRTAPTGAVLDTLNLTSPPAGNGPFWELVGNDTLVKLFRAVPYPFRYRVGILLNGTLAYPPTAIPIDPEDFELPYSYNPYVWKAGSYWILGLVSGPNGAHSIAMIHVPGPNEPPNAVSDRRPFPSPNSLSVSVSPNPVENQLRLELSALPASKITLRLFNILGQEIVSTEFTSVSSPVLSISLPHRLPSGTYYGLITAGHQTRRFTFIHL